ncbi:MAG: hypothetical protein MSA90_14175 [Faecalicatena sp.]|uniref:hypothetical protein n=1 Tax=Faecalicatena sp. TaxID=2005360 RepID=UPI00258A3109|nr:hypothetical protein [Faecalicatena sp.]MCI6466597.1 hypothetical protein [Faecalicatena sp.]MDY5617972.1 hypothetical protein [Lachnospiraceae bacterium]
MNEKEFVESFKKPPVEFRAKPFWAWNGRLDKEELFRQIEIMKEMGFGGFFMHSRTGLQTEYLGEEWFDLINECADKASGQGLEAWIYDEDRWPSGIAGGLVTQEERFRAKFIEMRMAAPGEYVECGENTLAVFSCEMEGNTFKKLKKVEQAEASDGENLLIFSIVYSDSKDVYNGYTYLDTMNFDAVEQFLELTHHQYAEKCGKRIGTSIRGVFTDEPHRGAMFSSFSEGSENRIPYTDQLFSVFEEECGYDLKQQLPYLFLREEGTFSKAALDYIEVCQKLFLKNFARPIQKWCSDNHMIFTGHVLHEDSLSAQTVMQGSLMRFYEYMDYPGIDILTEKNECWWVVKQAVSVARQLDKPFVLSELYGGTGWQMTLENYKQVGDWQALFGVNLRCPHLSWYTMQGEAKRDYPASIFYQSAWYREYEKLETYFARIGMFTSQGKNECSLLVLNPIESVWGYSRSGAFLGLEAADSRIQYLEKRYQEVFGILVSGHVEFDYGEESILEKHGKVENGLIYVGKCCYQKVLIAGMDTIRMKTLDLLEEFREQGGSVIFAGERPKYVDGILSEHVEEVAQRCVTVKFSKDQILQSCRNETEIVLEGEGAGEILCRISSDEDARYMMLLNSNRNQAHRDIKISFGAENTVELWNARDGEIRTILEDNEQSGTLTVQFAPGEEKLYRISKRTKELPDLFTYSLSEENVLVLDFVEAEIGGNRFEGEVLKTDRKIRNYLGLSIRGGEMLQPWYIQKYERQQYEKRWDIELKYTFHIRKLPSRLYLAFEDVEHVSDMRVNGSRIQYNTENYWIDRCFSRVEIPYGSLKEGENEIKICSRYGIENGLEAVYLLGEFGVYNFSDKGKWELSQLPRYLKAGDVTYQGLPFYSGSIRYDLPEMEGAYQIQDIKFAGSCVKIIGDSTEVLFAPPYMSEMNQPRNLEVVLTRRNTFGPLHCSRKRLPAYGPEVFLMDQEEWQDEYSLIGQGLLEKPRIRRMNGQK